jgi:hypothetical protein
MVAIEGSCLCGAVHWHLAGPPERVGVCNCTACRRHGAITAYGHEGVDITVSGPTRTFTRGPDLSLEFHFCPVCGCYAFWRATSLEPDGRRRLAVNLRLAEPGAVAALPVHRFDGFDRFVRMPPDGRCVRDYWF